MNNIILICMFILFAMSTVRAQSTLVVNIKDCREEGGFKYLSEFKLFKNDTFIKAVKPKQNTTQTIENLDNGKYRIDYKSIFDKTESLFIDISGNETDTVDLCLDYINYAADPYIPFIRKLQNGESYSIEIDSRGCFHSKTDSILIKNKSGKYYVVYGQVKRKLLESEITIIERFEIELNHMESLGCTTTDFYVLKYKDEEIRISDGSCNWNGDYYLKKALGFITD